MIQQLVFTLVLFTLGSLPISLADDWPQFMGPNRDSVWAETGIVERFPKEGLKTSWRVKVGLGYAGPAVADGRVFVFDFIPESNEMTNNPGLRSNLKGKERILALDEQTGKILWTLDVSFKSKQLNSVKSSPSLFGFFGFRSSAHEPDWISSEAFLDVLENQIKKLEKRYRAARASAKEIPSQDPNREFKLTADHWYNRKWDRDQELWQIFSEISALEFYFYRMTNIEIVLTQKYLSDPTVKVRDRYSGRTLEQYFSFSKNPQRAIVLARRMAQLEYRHAESYNSYSAFRDVLVRFQAYHWEFHDLLLAELGSKHGEVPSTPGLNNNEAPQFPPKMHRGTPMAFPRIKETPMREDRPKRRSGR